MVPVSRRGEARQGTCYVAVGRWGGVSLRLHTWTAPSTTALVIDGAAEREKGAGRMRKEGQGRAREEVGEGQGHSPTSPHH